MFFTLGEMESGTVLEFNLKIFLDDIRSPADDQWHVIRNVPDLITFYRTNFDNIEVMSFDHDLGDGVPTGYDFLSFLEKEVYEGTPCGMGAYRIKFILHTANPVGKRNMQSVLDSINRYFEKL